jgi:4-amino-4-deoxy-L-arabinose transferase-like glycosyltransferase
LRKTPDHRFALVFLAISLGFGLFLRIHNLGKFGFWIDELFHAIGARSLLETGSPVVPGMLVYTRAYPFTAITAFFFENFGISEAVGRAPSVIAGAIFLVAGFFLVRRLFDSSLAALFTFVMAFSPLEILWDRQCRMYALFRLLYFSAAMLFYMGFEADDPGPKSGRPGFLQRVERTLGVNLFLLACATILFYLSKKFHPLSYNFAFVLSVYCSLMFVVSLQRYGIRPAVFSKYFAVVAGVIGGAMTLRLLAPGLYESAREMISGKPFWDTYNLDYKYYLRYLWQEYPVLLVIYPAGIWYLIAEYGKKGLFVFCSFAPLFLMHMFLYTNNINERYILYIFPFFAIGSISFVDFLLKKGTTRVKDLWSRKRAGQSFALASGMVLIVAVASYPWVGSAFEIATNPHFDDWKSVSPDLRRIPGESVIVSTRRMPLYYYYGRNPDYVIIQEFEELIRKEILVPSRKKPLFMDVKWVFSAEELDTIMQENGDVYFISDTRSHWNPAFLDDNIRRSIARNMGAVQHGGDQRILIFRKSR